MDPISTLIVPCVAGGAIVAVVLLRLHRRSAAADVVAPPTHDAVSLDMINMAHIRVAGAGGAGLVAVSALVAIYLPTIRIAVASGLVLGMVFAAVLIVWRRKAGPISSSSQRPGSNTVLSIDATGPVPPKDTTPTRGLERATVARI